MCQNFIPDNIRIKIVKYWNKESVHKEWRKIPPQQYKTQKNPKPIINQKFMNRIEGHYQ